MDEPPSELFSEDMESEKGTANLVHAVMADRQSDAPIYVVGVGASAGGLEALGAFFSSMPADMGVAIIVVQHLSPDFRSMMDELLSRRTEMPVINAEDGMPIRRNSVYLIPPRTELTVADGCLVVTSNSVGRSLPLPIDVFFQSLADEYGSRAIAVVLSGTGADGSRGVQAVHQTGGLVIVQALASAKFDGMPRSAIATSVADFIVPPEAIPEVIQRHLSAPGTQHQADYEPDSPDENLRPFRRVIRLLRERLGLDLTNYKPTTVARRIERRVLLSRCETVAEYLELAEDDPSELTTLYHDLLIGVTRFFRDHEAFEALSLHLADLVPQKVSGEEGFRAWVPGCATGEEAYTIAMLCHDIALRADQFPMIRIFATDIHRDSLEYAAAGRFASQKLDDIPAEFSSRYFSPVGNDHQICNDIRRLVVFARQDVINEPPFTKVDFISCRNLLIYLTPDAQQKVLSVFQFALNRDGILFLGPSETLGDMSDEFEVVNPQWRIYRKRPSLRMNPRLSFSSQNLASSTARAAQSHGQAYNQPSLLARRVDEINNVRLYTTLLERYLPACIMINGRDDIVHTFGGAGRYLQNPRGPATLNIFKLVDDELQIALTAAVPRCRRERAATTYKSVRIRKGEDSRAFITLKVEPVLALSDNEVFVLISFIDETVLTEAARDDKKAISFNIDDEAKARIELLDKELQYTRESLQSTVEELETSNEELQATNEELMASNEELQSTNEELNSVNEELYTVNGEYLSKIHELDQLTADMDNVFRIADIGVLFVDKNLYIRKFTSFVADFLNLLPQDVNRPLAHVTAKIGSLRILELIEFVGETGDVVIREFSLPDGRNIILRVIRYVSDSDDNGGVVALFMDKSSNASNDGFGNLVARNDEGSVLPK